MDKPSEQRKQTKDCDDTDIGIQNYGAGGKREQLAGLWNVASKETVGLPPSRLATNCYTKEEIYKKPDKGLLGVILDEHDTRGPPLLDTSKPKRIF